MKYKSPTAAILEDKKEKKHKMLKMDQSAQTYSQPEGRLQSESKQERLKERLRNKTKKSKHRKEKDVQFGYEKIRQLDMMGRR